MRLLATYKTALATFDKVRCHAFQSLAPGYITSQEAAQARQDAKLAMIAARKAYWRHVEGHECRRLILTRPTVSGTISIHV